MAYVARNHFLCAPLPVNLPCNHVVKTANVPTASLAKMVDAVQKCRLHSDHLFHVQMDNRQSNHVVLTTTVLTVTCATMDSAAIKINLQARNLVFVLQHSSVRAARLAIAHRFSKTAKIKIAVNHNNKFLARPFKSPCANVLNTITCVQVVVHVTQEPVVLPKMVTQLIS